MKKKIKLSSTKPRNPFVVAALQRQAGSHQPTHKQERQRLKRELRSLKTALVSQ